MDEFSRKQSQKFSRNLPIPALRKFVKTLRWNLWERHFRAIKFLLCQFLYQTLWSLNCRSNTTFQPSKLKIGLKSFFVFNSFDISFKFIRVQKINYSFRLSLLNDLETSGQCLTQRHLFGEKFLISINSGTFKYRSLSFSITSRNNTVTQSVTQMTQKWFISQLATVIHVYFILDISCHCVSIF